MGLNLFDERGLLRRDKRREAGEKITLNMPSKALSQVELSLYFI